MWPFDVFKKLEKSEKENKILRCLLTDTWRLLSDAHISFGDEGPQYYDGWNRYNELEKRCDPYLNPFYEEWTGIKVFNCSKDEIPF